MPRSFSDIKRLLSPDSTAPHAPASGPGGMDRVIARKSRWPRYAALATVAILICGGAFWALRGAGGNIYRVPLADALRAADEQRRKSAVAKALQHLEPGAPYSASPRAQ